MPPNSEKGIQEDEMKKFLPVRFLTKENSATLLPIYRSPQRILFELFGNKNLKESFNIVDGHKCLM